MSFYNETVRNKELIYSILLCRFYTLLHNNFYNCLSNDGYIINTWLGEYVDHLSLVQTTVNVLVSGSGYRTAEVKRLYNASHCLHLFKPYVSQEWVIIIIIIIKWSMRDCCGDIGFYSGF